MPHPSTSKSRRSEARDRIYDQERVFARIAHQPRNAFNVMPCACGTLGGLHVDGANVGCKLPPNLIECEGLAIGNADQFDGASESLRQIAPALAKLSGSENQHFVSRRGQV